MKKFIQIIRKNPAEVSLTKVGQTTKVIITVNKEIIFKKKYFGLSYCDLVGWYSSTFTVNNSSPTKEVHRAYLKVVYLKRVRTPHGYFMNSRCEVYEELNYDWETEGD